VNKLYSLLLILAFFVGITGCTNGFESTNTNPYGVTQEDLTQDYMNIGGYFAQLQQNIYTIYGDLQVEQNLTGDAFAQYMVTPTPFMSNRNNVTYKFVWYGSRWNNDYAKIMPVILYFKRNEVDKQFPNFYAWANVLKIFAMQRVTDNYGPIIYSQYGSTNSTINYDTQQKVYYSFFSELDSAVSVLTTYAKQGNLAFKKFDLAYAGNVSQWVKIANSLRLRLAIRISKVDPVRAKYEAEKAISQSYGVIENNIDNLNIALNGTIHPLWIFSQGWSDARMCATVGSIMGGYNDPRLPVYFAPATDILITGTYTGIRQGIDISSKSTYVDFSSLGSMYETAKSVQIMTAAEVAFLRSEGALRGWNMGGTAQYYYNQGIGLSLTQYGLSNSYNGYVNDKTSTFAPYVDPKNSLNSFTPSSSITIKWDDDASNEQKLERIITQKWIAVFPDGQEAWSEFRRTGYPKLLPVVVNYSGGSISTSQFVRRTPYPDEEYTSNPAGVAGGVALLGGPDTGGTRVWWDAGGSNF